MEKFIILMKLKKKLILYGYKFETTSDTEVVIKAFDKWKSKSFENLMGCGVFVYTTKIQKKSFFHVIGSEKNLFFLL